MSDLNIPVPTPDDFKPVPAKDEPMPKFRVGQKVVVNADVKAGKPGVIYTITEVDASKAPFLYSLKGENMMVPLIREDHISPAPEVISPMFAEMNMRKQIEQLEKDLADARQAQFSELREAQKRIEARDIQIEALREEIEILKAMPPAPVVEQPPQIETKTLIQSIGGYSDTELAEYLNGWWTLVHETSFLSAAGNFFRVIRFERRVQPQPEKQKPQPSVAAMLTSDEVARQVHAPADEKPLEEIARETDVNAIEDEQTRQEILYQRRKQTLGAKRAAQLTFKKKYPIAAELMESGKDAVLLRLNDEVFTAAKAAYEAAQARHLGQALPPLSAYSGNPNFLLPPTTP